MVGYMLLSRYLLTTMT